MYSAYKLNKQGDNIQPWHTPFPIWNQSVVHVQFFFFFFLICYTILMVIFMNACIYFFYSARTLLLLFYFILFLNFTILYWFCQISKWIHHRYTCVPHPEPSSLLPPIPSLWVVPVHQPQASSIVHQNWTGDSFHIWYYTCFNAILLNPPTLSLSHRVQKTVLYISVSFAALHTGLSLPSF